MDPSKRSRLILKTDGSIAYAVLPFSTQNVHVVGQHGVVTNVRQAYNAVCPHVNALTDLGSRMHKHDPE